MRLFFLTTTADVALFAKGVALDRSVVAVERYRCAKNALWAKEMHHIPLKNLRMMFPCVTIATGDGIGAHNVCNPCPNIGTLNTGRYFIRAGML